MILLIGNGSSPMFRILRDDMRQCGIDCLVMDIREPHKIRIGMDELTLDDHHISGTATIITGIQRYFPFLPPPTEQSARNGFYQDYPAHQQQTSHLYSFLHAISDACPVINPFPVCGKTPDHWTALSRLRKLGFDLPATVMTNKIDGLNQIDTSSGIRWCYPQVADPLKKLERDRIPALFESLTDLPVIVFEDGPGLWFRSFQIGNTTPLTVIVRTPEVDDGNLSLESYRLFLRETPIQKGIQQLQTDLGTPFLEVYGRIDPQDRFVLYGYDPDPDFTALGPSGISYLARALIRQSLQMSGLKEDGVPLPDLPDFEQRTIMQLTRMLEPWVGEHS